MKKQNNRVLTVQVQEVPEHSDKKRTVGAVLQQEVGLTKKEISRAKFLPDGIRKNGIRCRVTEEVQIGDLLEILLEEEVISDPLEGTTQVLEILYEDQDLLAVNKPAGVVTHPKGHHYKDTLANQIKGYYESKQEQHTVRPVGRLDKDTSGIVVFAKNQAAAARLQKQRLNGTYKKWYLAVTRGKENSEQAEEKIEKAEADWNIQIEEIKGWNLIDQRMKQDPKNRLRMILADDGKCAKTWYKSLKNRKGYQIYALTLETGRTHQIRLHMASCGWPLEGDPIYGGGQTKIQRAALHAWKVELIQPFTGEKIVLEAPMPEDMKQIFES